MLATSLVILIATVFERANASASSSALSLRHLLSAEPLQRLRALSQLSDDDVGAEGSLTRPFGGPAHVRAAEEIKGWFEDAGLERVWLDAVCNVRGSLSFGGGSDNEKEVESEADDDASELLLGSHYDTVRGAGSYDGALGIVAAVAAVKAAARRAAEAAEEPGAKTPSRRRTVEVVAFSDEEGLRFGTTLLGSSALAGTLLSSGALEVAVDGEGVRLRDALMELKEKRREERKSTFSSSLDEDVAACALSSPSRPLSRYRGYVEAHMEQGPTLEAENARLSAESGISGQTRLGVLVKGEAGHAGTVPMNGNGGIRLRRDAAAGAAEVMLAVERICEAMSGGGGGGGGIGRKAAVAALARALRAATGNGGGAAAAFLLDRSPLFLRESLQRLRSSLPPAAPDHLVCTVGRLSLRPNAPNVIASSAELVADVRSSSDAARAKALDAIRAAIAKACSRRSLECETATIHEARASAADPKLTAAVEGAARASEAAFLREVMMSKEENDHSPTKSTTATTPTHVARARPSGAGHDALALSAARVPWAMLFVRDVRGVSHSREERVRGGDVGAAAAALYELVVEHLGLG